MDIFEKERIRRLKKVFVRVILLVLLGLTVVPFFWGKQELFTPPHVLQMLSTAIWILIGFSLFVWSMTWLIATAFPKKEKKIDEPS
jgi:hypothetical protein